MHHIGRIDHDRTNRHGWRVTIQRWNRVSIRNFSDRHHGGRDQAQAAAQVYRHHAVECAVFFPHSSLSPSPAHLRFHT